MKIFITSHFFKTILTAKIDTKKKLEQKLIDHIQKNDSLYTCSISLLSLYEEPLQGTSSSELEIIESIETICDQILEVNLEVSNLSIRFYSEYKYPILKCIELSVSVLNGIHSIIDTENTFSSQKLVRLDRVLGESK